MDQARPLAEAVAVRAETIVAVGDRAAVLAMKGRATQVVELGSKTLLPGFIDSHGHLTAVAALSQAVNLSSPPSGNVRTITELQQALRRHIKDHAIAPGSWVVGWGYDDAMLGEHRHPTRADLDAVSTEHLIYLTHTSGHFGVANSRLLALAQLTAESANPPGGVIRREVDGRLPNGVLEESAHMAMAARIPQPDGAMRMKMLRDALAYYASMGITTVQDGGATPDALAWLDDAARQGMLPLDVVAYRFWMPVGAAFPTDHVYGVYDHRLKVGGIKLMLDGSPQGKTAFLSKPYLLPPAGQAPGYLGYPSMPPAMVNKAVREALMRQVPVIAHANGDAAAQMLIDAVEAARRDSGNLTTTVTMIHAQTVRDDQLDRMPALAMIPSFFCRAHFFLGRLAS